jgi:DNA primase
MGLNVDKNFYNCFKTQMSGTLTDFVAKIENCSFGEASRLIGSGDIVSVTNTVAHLEMLYKKKQQERKDALRKLEYDTTALPSNCHIINEETIKESIAIQRAYSFLIKKVHSHDTVMRMRTYLSVNDELFNYVILPYYVDNKIVYYIARALDAQSTIRYLYPSVEEIKKEKNNYLYDYEYRKHGDTIIICEGIFNAIVAGGMALGGKTISDRQIDYLLAIPNSTNKKFVVALDQDTAGRGSIVDVCTALKKYFKNVFFLATPDIMCEDFSDIGYDNSATLLSKYTYPACAKYYMLNRLTPTQRRHL